MDLMGLYRVSGKVGITGNEPREDLYGVIYYWMNVVPDI